MHRKLGLAVILCLILSLLSGCGTPPAPEPAEGAELPDLVSSRAERWSTAEDMETGYSLPGLNEQNASGLGQEPTAITWPSELPSGPAPSSDEAQTGTGPLDEPAGTVPPPAVERRPSSSWGLRMRKSVISPGCHVRGAQIDAKTVPVSHADPPLAILIPVKEP